MKKGLYAIFTAAVLLLSVTLAAGIAIAGPASAGANEILAPQPKVLDREGKLNDGFLGEAAAWFDDHFFLRQEFISLNNWLSAKLFGVSEAKNVTLGRDGWLYYTPALADYTGTAAMSDGELRDAARNLELMAEFCREEGREFLFAIAPNKSSLYPEHLKGLEPGGGETNAQRLFALLEEKQVPYCDLFRLFREQEETLYFAHDSHWNSRGAALAADGINKAFGRESDYFSGGFTPALHSGDLYEMLYPGFSDGETDMVYSSPWAFSYVGEANRPDSINLLTAGSGKEASSPTGIPSATCSMPSWRTASPQPGSSGPRSMI